MYFRTKSIKGSKLVQLVESYRNEEGQPRQRVVVSLGDAQLPEGEKRLIGRAVERQLQGQSDLPEPRHTQGNRTCPHQILRKLLTIL
jgi:hypothetical protein